MLDELIEKRYFLQFKKRDGKKDTYKYIYRHSSFSDDEIIELKKILSDHHFVMLGDTQESNLGTGKRTSQETPSNQGLLDCSFSGVQNQVSIFECSNPSSNRIHMEDNTHINNTHIDNTQSLDSFSLDDDDEKKYICGN